MGINVLGYQTTLRDRIEFTGVGVHSGKPVTMSLIPADGEMGVVFSVLNAQSGNGFDIPGNINFLGATDLCSVLGDPAGVFVATVEHLMAALRSCGVDNVIVELDASEVPVMDGSAHVFVEAIENVGLTSLSATRCYIRVKEPVRVDMGASWGELVPYDGTRFEVEIDFDCKAIGRQKFAADMNANVFRDEISRARTFGFMKDVERLWAAGFAIGSTLDNSVVIDDDQKVINPEGLRFEDEFVRHKTLDAIGDLALCGAPLLGCFRSYRGGHKLNSLVLRKLLSQKDAFEFVGSPISQTRVHHGELVTMSAPAYAANLV
ncbi:MAG: UDP-3-O-acyl-N-acetylglucosamine deacetylase [Rhizobiaceae bacterium]|nr:UDP-3-O-acyl-N-acetylglucosamine deacetylase [Rhizobiaceae bacterium]